MLPHGMEGEGTREDPQWASPRMTTGWPGVTGLRVGSQGPSLSVELLKEKGASSHWEQGTAESTLFPSRMFPAKSPWLLSLEHSHRCRAGEQGQRVTRTVTAAAGAGL